MEVMATSDSSRAPPPTLRALPEFLAEHTAPVVHTQRRIVQGIARGHSRIQPFLCIFRRSIQRLMQLLVEDTAHNDKADILAALPSRRLVSRMPSKGSESVQRPASKRIEQPY